MTNWWRRSICRSTAARPGSKADLGKPNNRHDWQRWTASLKIPNDGYYEILVRATDTHGVAQPFAPSHWNPHGYGVNPMHRIAVTIGK